MSLATSDDETYVLGSNVFFDDTLAGLRHVVLVRRGRGVVKKSNPSTAVATRAHCLVVVVVVPSFGFVLNY